MTRFMAGFAAGCAVLVTAAILLAHLPVTSREGVDDTVKDHRIALWEKVARFLVRHAEFQRMVEEAASGEADPQRRVLRLMDWTRRQVRLQPSDLPLIDDHISHIVLRHYGNEGQMAEVCTALTTYTGNDGRWAWSNDPHKGARLALCFIKADEGWWVFDILHGAWFERPDGKIATVEDFRDKERLRIRGQAPESYGGVPYRDFFIEVEKVWQRGFSRAPGQIPWHRLLMVLGLEPAG